MLHRLDHRQQSKLAHFVDGSWSKHIANFGSHKDDIETSMSPITDKALIARCAAQFHRHLHDS
jgi:hypothetical protein